MMLLDFLFQRMRAQVGNLLQGRRDCPPSQGGQSLNFAQENNTSRIVYSNGYGHWEREGVQRQLIASTATINKRVLWFRAELTNIMQTRDATSNSSFIHPACTPTKLTEYANSKHSNKRKKWYCFFKHTSPHLTTPHTYIHINFKSACLRQDALQIPGCSQKSWMFYKAIAVNIMSWLGSHWTSQVCGYLVPSLF